MRLVSRMSSVLAATALVGTSFTLAVPAIAVEAPVGDEPTATTEVVEDGSAEELASVSPGEEAEDEASQEAPEEQAIATLSDTDAVPMADAVGNPTIAEVRARADGESVTTEGWVTAAWPTGGLNGFTIQTAGTGGACELDGQSDAIFVYTNHSSNVAPTPEIGKYVEVTGLLGTNANLRQISTSPASSAGTKIKVLDSTGVEAATPISCAWPATEAQRRSIESMLYLPTSDAGFAITNNYGANTFGGLGISTTGKPLNQPSDVTADTDARKAIEEGNKANSFEIDDGATFNYTSNANNKLVPPYVYADGTASVGSMVTFVDPMIVDFRNNVWKLNPTTRIESSTTGVVSALPVEFSDYTIPTAPGTLGGDLVVGGFNVENYFPTSLGADWAAAHPGANCTSYKDNTGAPITVNRCDPVTQDGVTVLNPRGAWTQESLDRQTDRIVNAINSLDAAALGLMELENSYKMSFGDPAKAGASAAYLVSKLNAAAGSTKWAYIEPKPENQQPIDNQDVMYPGIIYQPAKVTPLENGQLTIQDQSGTGQPFNNARAPFGQAFKPTDGGKPFFLVANHFKSKSSPGTGEDADLGEGGWNPSRVAQANALADWVNNDVPALLKERTGYKVEDSVLVGDFNSYSFEKPMLDLYAAGFVNVNIKDGKPENASYNYGGLNGSLDHVLISESAVERATGHAIWNVNAPQQIGLNYSRYNVTGGEFVQDAAGTPLRSSDHDPAVVGFKVGADVVATTELTLLNINDFHGRIDGALDAGDSAFKPGAWVTDDKGVTKWVPGSTTVNFGYTVDALRNAAPYDNSLFLSAGDNVGASLFPSALDQDTPTIDVLNALGLEASAVGNHEFDAGWADLRDRLTKEFDGVLLGANVYKEGTTTPVLPEYVILDAAGLKVAVIGVVTEDTPTLVNPDNVAGLTFGDPVDAVNRVAAKLNGMPAKYRPDVIVAEYHEGAAAVGKDSTLADKIAAGGIFARIVLDTDASVNAIFNGHTHQEYTWSGPVPGNDEATRPVVSTGQYGTNVGKVVLSVGVESKDVEDYSMELVNVAKFAEGKTIAQMTADNPTVQAVYDITLEAVQNAKIQGSVPVAKMTQTISRDYTKGKYVDGKWQMDGSANNRDNESPMGTLVGNMLRDGQMATLPISPDFGVTNPGGLRTDFNYTDANKGIITVADARAVLPFNNNLSIAQMTGEQIVTMLEQQWQRDADNKVPSRSYLQLGLSDNISYTYHEVPDPAHEGFNLGIVDSVTLNGEPLKMDQVYNVGTFEFLSAGGDNFWVFRDADVIDTGLVDWESWLDYLSAASGMTMGTSGPEFATPIAPQFTRQGVAVEGMPADGFVAGEEVTLTFRNMNIHAVGAPANTELAVTLAGESVGTFPITMEQVANGNWTDSATVKFTVPAGFGGEGDLVATAAPTGTKVVVPSVTKDEPVTPEPNVRRASGPNRFETNLAVNKLVPAKTGGTLIVATGMDFADSLSASPAAAVTDGSLFLTAPGGLSKAQLAEIANLKPTRVYIVGGTGAVSNNVATQLLNTTGLFPVRVAGANRYETSAKVFQTFFNGADVEYAFVATGRTFPDALSASAAAGALGAPVLLVDGVAGKNLLAPSLQLLGRLGVENINIAGGTGAVNKTIQTNLAKSFDSVTRLGGADRYQTNLSVNNYVNGLLGVSSIEGVWVATGKDFPDALSAAPKAGDASQRLVLSDGKCIMKPVVSEWIMGADSQVEWTTLVGGTGVLPKALEKLPECK